MLVDLRRLKLAISLSPHKVVDVHLGVARVLHNSLEFLAVFLVHCSHVPAAISRWLSDSWLLDVRRLG